MGLLLCALGLVACRSADVNGDGVVDAADLAALEACLDADATGACESADLDRDGRVDSSDRVRLEARLAPARLPALAASEPASGASAVPRATWLRLDFAEAFAPRDLAALALECEGTAHPFHAFALDADSAVVNPRVDLPPDASCTLSWRRPDDGLAVLAFQTALDGVPGEVYYDRTDTTQVAPIPDDAWLVADSATATGLRVAVPVPEREPDVVQLFTSLTSDAALLDGWSPLAPIVVELSDAPDPASLPTTVAASLDPLASVGLFDLTQGSDTFGERVPFELHVRNDTLGDQPESHSLVVFPSVALAPGGRYGFVVTRRARVDAAHAFAPSAFLAAALAPASAGEDPAIAALRPIVGDVIAGVAAANPPIPRDDVALALRITVRTIDRVPDDVLAMREQVFAEAPPFVTLTSVGQSTTSGRTLVRGTWRAPSWLQGAFLARDADGRPRIARRVELPFLLTLPAAAAQGPVPVVVYKHPNPSDVSALSEETYAIDRAGFAVAGFTDVMNRQYPSVGQQLAGIFGTLLFGARLPDLWVEGYGEQLAFLRVLETLAQRDFLPRTAPDGRGELDLTRPLGFYGASRGGFLAYAPEIRAASVWSGDARLSEVLFLQDTTDPHEIGGLLDFIAAQVPSVRPPEVWAGLSMFQMLFDQQDPLLHAAFLSERPLEVAGTRRKASVLVSEEVLDSASPNGTTRAFAALLGRAAQLEPVIDPVPFLPRSLGREQGNVDGETTAAFVQRDCLLPFLAAARCGVADPTVAFLRSALDGGAPVILSSAWDTDGDGLSDLREPDYGADPALPDTDGDGMLDGPEADGGLDPGDPGDVHEDPDGDGLDNAAEIALGTKPRNVDTDGDGLADGREWVLGTSPLLADTDGGGASDGQEVDLDGSDPFDPVDDRPLVRLPAELIDGEGARWNVWSDGRLGGRFGPIANGFEAMLYGRWLSGTARSEERGREIVIGPGQNAALRWTRKVFVPDDDGFARVLEIVENPTLEAREASISVSSRIYGQVVATSDGDATFTADDDTAVFDDATAAGGTNPLAVVISGATPRVEPSHASATLQPSGESSVTSFTIPMVAPARGRAIAMYFVARGTDAAAAVAKAERLRDLGGSALDGLSSAERKAIVNFSCAPDADGDGVLDFDEAPLGTDPANPDSDGDGLLDGFEVDHGFAPLDPAEAHLDPDADGLDNLGEQGAGTEPRIADTDEDTLDDGAEVAIGTSPLRPDTDGDRLDDATEVARGTDPFADADADGDGVDDDLEILGIASDPFDADTDDDGLGDGLEFGAGLSPTDPTDAHADFDLDGLDNAGEIAAGSSVWEPDTDYDGLDDGDEVALGTNPNTADTDGGGRWDSDEIRDETDPLDPSDDLATVTLPFLLADGAGHPWLIEWHAISGGEPRAIEFQSYEVFGYGGATWLVEGAGREVVLGESPHRKKVFVPPDGSFVRVLDQIRYEWTSTYGTSLDLYAYFGAGTDAHVVASSSGDAVLSVADDYAVVDDADGAGFPAVVQVFAGAGAARRADQSGEWSPGFTYATYLFATQPRDLTIVMSFLALAETRAEAIALAEWLLTLPPEALEGMSERERAAVVNFAVPPSTPAP